MTKNGAINLGVWLGLVVFTALGMTVINYSSLRTGGTMKSTEGSVIGYVPGEHQGYRYAYSVNGRTFQGSATSRERAEEMKLGGSVTVFYDESNPGNSTLAAPRTLVVTRVVLIVAVCAVIPVLLMWGLHALRLLPPCKFVQDCREWVRNCREWIALRFPKTKSKTRTKVKASHMPAARETASAK